MAASRVVPPTPASTTTLASDVVAASEPLSGIGQQTPASSSRVPSKQRKGPSQPELNANAATLKTIQYCFVMCTLDSDQ
jgi:hypothetical protein